MLFSALPVADDDTASITSDKTDSTAQITDGMYYFVVENYQLFEPHYEGNFDASHFEIIW